MAEETKDFDEIYQSSNPAQITFFDNVLSFGVLNGVVQLGVGAQVVAFSSSGKPQRFVQATGQLRCTVEAARNLHKALSQALAIADQKTERNLGSATGLN